MQRKAFPTKNKIERRPFPILFVPEWETGSFQPWAKKFVEKNYWRVAHVLQDKEDAHAHCAMVFALCLDKYIYNPVKGKKRVDNPRWFMSLFQRAVINQFHKLAEKDTQYRDTIDTSVGFDNPLTNQDEARYVGIDRNAGPLSVAITELPFEYRLVLNRLLESPAELIAFLFHSVPHVPDDMPKPDPGLLMKRADRLLHELCQIALLPRNRTHDFIARLRGLAGL